MDVNKILRSIANGYDDTTTKRDVKALLFAEMKEKIIRQASYNYDYTKLIPTNLGEVDKTFIKKYIFRNNIESKLLKVVRNASEHGISGILERIGAKSVISQNVYIFGQPVYDNEVLLYTYLSTDYVDLTAYDEENLSLMKLWLNNEGNYVLSYVQLPQNEDGDGYSFENERVEIVMINDEEHLRQYVYDDFEGCPLEILENNESARSDWSYAAESTRLFAKFDSVIETEWEYLKVQLINNLLLNPDKEGSEIQSDIENGRKRIHDYADQNGMGGTSLQTFSAGGITAEIARIIKENYKEEIKELTFAIGSLSGGNNKHTSEAIMSNFDGFKYLYAKKNYFKVFVSKLFAKILTYSKVFNSEIEYEDDILEVDVKFSPVIELILTEATNNKLGGNPTPKQEEQK